MSRRQWRACSTTRWSSCSTTRTASSPAVSSFALDATDNDIARLLRRRSWVRLHDGVYLNHTGCPSWTQRAWAAVLYYWPAALTGRSALRVYGVRNGSQADGDPIEVVIDASRSIASLEGVRVSRIKGFDDLALLHLRPPRITGT
jgi:hypothetical protein